jgi:hypothetical protein
MNPLGILSDIFDAASYTAGPQAQPFGYHSSQMLPGLMQSTPSPEPLDAYRAPLGSLQAQTYPLNVAPAQAYSEAAAGLYPTVDPLAGRGIEDDLFGGGGGLSGDPAANGKKTDWRQLFADVGKGLGDMGDMGAGGYPGVPGLGGGLGILEGIPPQYILPLLELSRGG